MVHALSHLEQSLREAQYHKSSHFTDVEIENWGEDGSLPKLPTAAENRSPSLAGLKEAIGSTRQRRLKEAQVPSSVPLEGDLTPEPHHPIPQPSPAGERAETFITQALGTSGEQRAGVMEPPTAPRIGYTELGFD